MLEGCCLIVTTGGTGPALRDVTPEATEAVCSKMMPGFGELMRSASLKFVPTAILSRQTAGIRGNSLIVNLPGKPSAIDDCLNAVFPAIPYCIDLIEGAYLESDPEQCKVFRPAHASPINTVRCPCPEIPGSPRQLLMLSVLHVPAIVMEVPVQAKAWR